MNVGSVTISVVLFGVLLVTPPEMSLARSYRHTTTISGGSNVEKGSGQLTTQQRDVGSFDRIESNIGADISISIGKAQSVNVTYDDNLVELISTRVKGGKLVIDALHSFSSSENCQIKIVVPDLEGVAIAGSGEVEVNGLSSDRFDVAIEGSADVTANGKVGELTIEIDGSGNVDTRDLSADEATVEINGSGNASVMARDYLTANISGSGDIIYSGEPNHIVRNVAGSGRIRRR